MDQMSFQDFLMWLQGVEEMQPEGWSPDQRQWEKIRDKMRCIEFSQQADPTRIIEELQDVVQQLSNEIVGLRMRVQQPAYSQMPASPVPRFGEPGPQWSAGSSSETSLLQQHEVADDGAYRPAFV